MSSIRIVRGAETLAIAERRGLLLGRDGSCDVVVKDTAASRRHASLEPEGTGWRITDLGSANGTFLNGTRLMRAAIVQSGDVVRIGREELVLLAEDEPTETDFVSVGNLRKNALEPSPDPVPRDEPRPRGGGGAGPQPAPLPATVPEPSGWGASAWEPEPAAPSATVGRHPRAFWVYRDGERKGPISETDVVAKMLRRELSPEDLAWTEGVADWQPLRSYPELLKALPPPPPPRGRR